MSVGHAMRAEHLERFERMVANLRQKKLKLTPQRLAILRLFCADESHPTAQDLYARLRPAFPTMSFATVYNTLDALALAGLTSTLHLGGASRFDPNTEPHHHAICDGCGSIADISLPVRPTQSPVDGQALELAAPGFSVRAVERVYRGLCAGCTRKAKKKKLLS
jgi:Fur family peroxide stress response transcriptional regulator